MRSPPVGPRAKEGGLAGFPQSRAGPAGHWSWPAPPRVTCPAPPAPLQAGARPGLSVGQDPRSGLGPTPTACGAGGSKTPPPHLADLAPGAGLNPSGLALLPPPSASQSRRQETGQSKRNRGSKAAPTFAAGAGRFWQPGRGQRPTAARASTAAGPLWPGALGNSGHESASHLPWGIRAFAGRTGLLNLPALHTRACPRGGNSCALPHAGGHTRGTAPAPRRSGLTRELQGLQPSSPRELL